MAMAAQPSPATERPSRSAADQASPARVPCTTEPPLSPGWSRPPQFPRITTRPRPSFSPPGEINTALSGLHSRHGCELRDPAILPLSFYKRRASAPQEHAASTSPLPLSSPSPQSPQASPPPPLMDLHPELSISLVRPPPPPLFSRMISHKHVPLSPPLHGINRRPQHLPSSPSPSSTLRGNRRDQHPSRHQGPRRRILREPIFLLPRRPMPHGHRSSTPAKCR
ncbi:hypothetical protein SORBI_3006G093600 [Sorghum bicolor]|uniref:Uncharacterized protein n=1 Tax=Sorghum bicolor TaxID=4558 RepID=A0A1B6PL41_SORBI|nr:hypothetical protein SORBI_3006G093600 [Sorghum bicolor]